MSLNPEEMGRMELSLTPMILWRCTLILLIPLIIAFLFHSFILKAVFWLIFAILAFQMVGSWGQATISVQVILVSIYIFFELKNSPDWLAYVVGFLVVFNIAFIVNRFREIEKLNQEFDRINQS